VNSLLSAAGKRSRFAFLMAARRPELQILDASRFGRVLVHDVHKIFAGLSRRLPDPDNAIRAEVLCEPVGLCHLSHRNRPEQQFQRMLNTEHGGMNEVLAASIH